MLLVSYTSPPYLIVFQHEGERDTRGPADFSGASSTRIDDGGDGDDDDGEDDEDDAPSLATRKRARAESAAGVGKLRPGHDQDNILNPDVYTSFLLSILLRH